MHYYYRILTFGQFFKMTTLARSPRISNLSHILPEKGINTRFWRLQHWSIGFLNENINHFDRDKLTDGNNFWWLQLMWTISVEILSRDTAEIRSPHGGANGEKMVFVAFLMDFSGFWDFGSWLVTDSADGTMGTRGRLGPRQSKSAFCCRLVQIRSWNPQ